MIENDELENLFRKEAQEYMSQEKPREIVWQKIEDNLKAKKKTPIKDFIQSVWFSAAVFALIAIPYIYFFIENMNLQQQNSQIVNSTIKEILNNNEPSIIHLDTILKQEEKQLAKNEVTEVNKVSKVKVYQQNPALEDSYKEIMPVSGTYTLSASTVETIPDKTKIISDLDSINDKIVQTEIKKTDTILIASARIAQNNESVAPLNQKMYKSDGNIQAASTSVKPIEPILIYRNRFVLQDQVNRVGFNFIKTSGNRIIFESNGIRLTLVRENGLVKILSNSKKINSNVLRLLQNNKERIYNYYINFDKATTEIIK